MGVPITNYVRTGLIKKSFAGIRGTVERDRRTRAQGGTLRSQNLLGAKHTKNYTMRDLAAQPTISLEGENATQSLKDKLAWGKEVRDRRLRRNEEDSVILQRPQGLHTVLNRVLKNWNLRCNNRTSNPCRLTSMQGAVPYKTREAECIKPER